MAMNISTGSGMLTLVGLGFCVEAAMLYRTTALAV